MDTDRKWVVVRIDGKIAAISTDYKKLAEISARLADGRIKAYTCTDNGTTDNATTDNGTADNGAKDNATTDNRAADNAAGRTEGQVREITATTVTLADVLKLKDTTRWEDLMLSGTEFQKRVWKRLWNLTHPEGENNRGTPHLISYSDFAELCQNRAGVRPVAHAVGLNPVAVLIPCHLVIPKESIDKIREIQKKAETTIFKGDDLCLESILSDPSIDFGEYALGKDLKRRLISMELA